MTPPVVAPSGAADVGELERCPKRMLYGPCGGVRGGDCEVPGYRCPFVHRTPAPWDAAHAPVDGPDRLRSAVRTDGRPAAPMARALADRLGRTPLITCDVPSLDAATTTMVGSRVGAHVDAVVIGEPAGARGGHALAHRASLLQAAGVPVIATLTCRDRNRVALEGEIAALGDVGVAALLAVTGDVDPDGSPGVWDLDSTRLAALARHGGHLAAVAESPAAPCISRAARLAAKVSAGARLCFVNAVDTAALARFANEAAAAGASTPLIAVVPFPLHPGALRRLRRLPGVDVRAGSPVDVADRAVDLARAALEIPGVAGVHLATGAGPEGALDAVERIATASAAIRGGGS